MEGQGMDRRLALALSLVQLAAPSAHSALEGNDPAPRLVRLAGSHPALPCGAQDFRGNPASLAAGRETWEVGAGHTRPLGLEGLSEQAGWLAWNSGPRRTSSVATSLAWRGFRADDEYRDDAGFATLAWRWKDASVGASANVLRVDYGESDVGLAGGAGLGAHLRLRDVALGAHVSDASILVADPGWMREPVEASMGAAIAPVDASWRSAATAAWRQEAGWTWRLAQEIALPWGFDAGVGLAFDPFRIACGAGWQVGWARLDAATEGDQMLGWQTHVSLSFAIR